jgi:hypothetical protein
MRKGQPKTSSRFRRRFGFVLAALLPSVAVLTGVIPGSAVPHAAAGTPPALLDDHRGDSGYLTLVNSLSPFFDGLPLELSLPEVAPLPFPGISLPPGPLITQDDQGPHSLGNPQIVNLFYDDNWDAHNPGAPSMEKIDQWTSDLAGSSYLDAAGQYGVGSASFKGGFQANGGSGTFCGWARNSGPTQVGLITLTQWVSCEAGYGRSITLGDPLTGVPGPNKNTLYVVYHADAAHEDDGQYVGIAIGVRPEGDVHRHGHHRPAWRDYSCGLGELLRWNHFARRGLARQQRQGHVQHVQPGRRRPSRDHGAVPGARGVPGEQVRGH